VRALGWQAKASALALFVLIVAGVALAIGLGSGSSHTDSSAAAAGRRLAESKATALLAGVALPAGATPTTSASGDQTGSLARIRARTASNVTAAHRTWTVPESAASAAAFLRAHPVPGTKLLTDSEATSGPVFSARELPPGLSAGRIGITVVAESPHAAVIHADVAVTWVVPRPASEVVPAGARVVDIYRGKPGHAPGISLKVTDPQLTKIRTLIDALPTVQPGTVHCPIQVPGLAQVSFVFRDHEGGQALAVASEPADVVAPTTACDPLSFSIGASAQTPLLGGAPLLRKVSRIIGHRLWLPPYAA
jgi:hypothetical protein